MDSKTGRKPRGIAIPFAVLGVMVTSIVVGSMVKYAVHGTHAVDQTFNKKVAFASAEAGLAVAAKELLKSPFFSRFILRDYVESARKSMGRPANAVGQIP